MRILDTSMILLAVVVISLSGCAGSNSGVNDAGGDAVDGLDGVADGGSDPGADLGGDPGADGAADQAADQAGDPGGDPGLDGGADQGSDSYVDGGTDGGGDDGPLFTVDPVEDFDDPLLRASLFFSPADGTQQIVLSELAAAQSSAHLAFFNIRLQQVADALVALHQAGKDVKVLMDQKQMDQPYNTLDTWMIDHGLDVVGVLNDSSDEATMHNKFTVIDGRRVLTGSMNYSTTAFNRSDEDLLLIDDPDIGALYEDELDELVAGEQVPRVDDPGAPLSVYFGSEDRLDLMTIGAIDGAQSEIEVIMFSAGLASLGDALIAAVNRGVNVTFLVDESQSQNSDLDETIEAGGVHVLRVQRSFPVELHDKLCMVDGQLVLAGSYNWTPLASFFNDENSVRLLSTAIATRVAGRVTELVTAEDPAFTPAGYGWSAGSRSVTFSVTNLSVRADGACYISGDDPALGSMDASKAVQMARADGALGETWSATVDLPAGSQVGYKFLVRGPDGVNHRETGNQRSFSVPYAPGSFQVYDTFRE